MTTATDSTDAERVLSAERVVAVMHRFHDALAVYAEALNRLNVYPVPDGDTGTNMHLTVGSVVDALDAVDESERGGAMAAVADAIAHGSLMGARGNSGIILSQILRGLADTFRSCRQVGSPEFTAALTAASESAYEAVVRPVEGTILTVVRRAAEGAREAGTSAGEDLGAVLQQVYERARDALAATPDMLPVLKDAGVVDAGGAGLLLMLASFVEEMTGAAVPLPSSILDAAAADAPVHHTIDDAPDVAELRYEVMFFLEADDGDVPAFRSAWADLGDSIAVVGGSGTYNCHIHTDDIGGSIEAGIAAGRPFDIRVTDLLEQAADVGHHGAAEPVFTPIDAVADARVGVVAVAAGAGVVEMFRELGVQAIVAGGQSMNPSTEELLAAVEAVPAADVIILPNNKNIVPVASQVDALATSRVVVLPTTSVPSGIAAMLAYDPLGAVEDLVAGMQSEVESVICGEVTRAVRDAVTPAGDVREGEWLSLVDGGIVAIADDADQALVEVVRRAARAESELVTVLMGADATDDQVAPLRAMLAVELPGAELELVSGGQPLYPFLVSVE